MNIYHNGRWSTASSTATLPNATVTCYLPPETDMTSQDFEAAWKQGRPVRVIRWRWEVALRRFFHRHREASRG